MSIILGTLQQGLLFGLLAVGIYISFRILNIPDLTTEGSFTFGLAVLAMITINGHPFLAILAGAASGFLAGVITGLLQTKCKTHPVLAGILTMSGLYSINMWVMGEKANVTLISTPQQPVNTVFSLIEEKLGITSSDISELIIIAVITAAVYAQYQRFADINSGVGMLVVGLASVIK